MRAEAPLIEEAIRLMRDFSERTGLDSSYPPRRYLWTDAFAVCNFLALSQVTGERRFEELAESLADQVHHVLGRHRSDDARSGWISGLDELQGEAHPTRGGLRIGKPLPERNPREALDEQLEWERDGQYFHYLTKWMFALDQLARSTRQARYNRWARELAEAAHAAFTYAPAGQRPGTAPRMAWKMSIDLSRPLVRSMGQHDPLDGLITCLQLQATAVRLSDSVGPRLERALADFASMVEGSDFTTGDPLGIGGLLTDACHLAQLIGDGGVAGDALLEPLLAAAARGLAHYAQRTDPRGPAARRLAFRELGLAIGLGGLAVLERQLEATPHRFRSLFSLQRSLEALQVYAPLGTAIRAFWLDPEHRRAITWSDHLEINEVMLATGLVPQGSLVLAEPA